MKTRRRVLGSVGALTLVGGTGCIGPLRSAWGDGNEEWGLEVTGAEPTLSPGEETTVHVDADPVQSLQIQLAEQAGLRSDGSEEPVELNVRNTTVEPDPSGGLDSMPPVWLWEAQTQVSVEIPVFVSEEADASEYPYGIEVTGGDIHSEEKEETVEFTITVTSD